MRNKSQSARQAQNIQTIYALLTSTPCLPNTSRLYMRICWVKGTKKDALEPSEEALLLHQKQNNWGFTTIWSFQTGTLGWLNEALQLNKPTWMRFLWILTWGELISGLLGHSKAYIDISQQQPWHDVKLMVKFWTTWYDTKIWLIWHECWHAKLAFLHKTDVIYHPLILGCYTGKTPLPEKDARCLHLLFRHLFIGPQTM